MKIKLVARQINVIKVIIIKPANNNSNFKDPAINDKNVLGKIPIKTVIMTNATRIKVSCCFRS